LEHEVRYELSRADLRRANRRLVTRHRAVRRVFLSGLVVGPLIAFVLLLAFGYSIVEAAVVGLFAVPVAAGVVLWRLSKRLSPALEVDERLIGTYTIRLDDRRIRANTPAGAWGERWEDIQAVHRGREATDVVLDDLRSLPIPHGAFASAEERRRFGDAVAARHARASASEDRGS
jgi:hypothetical protein